MMHIQDEYSSLTWAEACAALDVTCDCAGAACTAASVVLVGSKAAASDSVAVAMYPLLTEVWTPATRLAVLAD